MYNTKRAMESIKAIDYISRIYMSNIESNISLLYNEINYNSKKRNYNITQEKTIVDYMQKKIESFKTCFKISTEKTKNMEWKDIKKDLQDIMISNFKSFGALKIYKKEFLRVLGKEYEKEDGKFPKVYPQKTLFIVEKKYISGVMKGLEEIPFVVDTEKNKRNFF